MTSQLSTPPSDPTRPDNRRALFAFFTVVGFSLLLVLNLLLIVFTFLASAFMCFANTNGWYCSQPVGIVVLLLMLPFIGSGLYFLSHRQRRYGLAATLMAISALIPVMMIYTLN